MAASQIVPVVAQIPASTSLPWFNSKMYRSLMSVRVTIAFSSAEEHRRFLERARGYPEGSACARRLDGIASEAENAALILEHQEADDAAASSLRHSYPVTVRLTETVGAMYHDVILEAARIAKRGLTDEWFWHLALAKRYDAARKLTLNGYYGEAMALTRTLWESAVILGAIAAQTPDVSLAGSFGVGENGDALFADNERLRIRENDTAARTWLDRNIDPSGRAAVKTLDAALHACVHKAYTTVNRDVGRIARGDSVSLLPRYDEDEATAALNILLLTGWCLLSSCRHSLASVANANASTVLGVRYEALLATFDEWAARNEATPLVGEFTAVVRCIQLRNSQTT